MSHNIIVEGGKSVRLPTAGKYCDRDIVVTAEGGSEDLDAVLTEQEGLISELTAKLEEKMVAEPNLHDVVITPTKEIQSFSPNDGYDGFSGVTVEAIPDEYIVPSGELSISANGTQKVTEYDSVNVNVKPKLTMASVLPTKSQQEIRPDANYDGLSLVTVEPIPDEYIVPSGTKNITENGTHDVTAIESVKVEVPIPDGYIVPSGTKEITENGTHDITNYASVNVNVASSGSTDDSVNAYLEGTVEEVNCSGITEVHPYMFYQNKGLKRVTLANAETVEGYNFYDCDALESIDLPKATGTVGLYFGYSCANLTTVNLPKVTGFNSYAFQSASSLEFIDLPMVESISNYGFRYCSKLKAVILRKTDSICTLGGTTAFAGSGISSKAGYIYVPSALIEEYKGATNWSKFSTQFRAIEDYPEICG